MEYQYSLQNIVKVRSAVGVDDFKLFGLVGPGSGIILPATAPDKRPDQTFLT